MAYCACGNLVRFDGQECDMCFMDRLITYFQSAQDLRQIRAAMMDADVELLRREWERTVEAHND